MSHEFRGLAVVVAVATLVAVVSARPYAGSWNDGSRLATVECLVDYGTLVIDDSIFVRASSVGDAETRSPYRGSALENGTLDKILIDGHFYSDKSPVLALLLALVYQVLQWCFGLRASVSPEAFCWWLTVLSSGVVYVAAMASMFRFGGLVQLPIAWRLLVTASFGLASVAVVYVQHVNNHILLLGVASVLLLQASRLVLDRAAGHESSKRVPVARLLLLGALAGLGYTIDLGAGPMLLVATAGLVAWVFGRRVSSLAWFAAGAFPWLALHHAMNYAVGGTIGPANAVPEYLQWEASPFQGPAVTGAWHHAGPIEFAIYALALLFGKRGFVGHNLGLFVFVGGALVLVGKIIDSRFSSFDWRREAGSPINNQKSKIKNGHNVLAIYFTCWCVVTWLAYAVASRNYSGANLGVRWFVPLLAPAYFGLAMILSAAPRYRADFLLLSVWGAILMAVAWPNGPWIAHMVPGFWFIQAGALGSWLWLTWRRSSAARRTAEHEATRVIGASVHSIEGCRAERREKAGVDPALNQVSK